MTEPLSPTAFFDQFVTHPRFSEVKGRMPWWCARHWAPCPAFGANGVSASIELTAIFLAEFAHGESDPSVLTIAIEEWETPMCCQLGDERMYVLWGKCGPS